MEINKFVAKLNKNRFTNNTQRVLYTLLTTNKEWVPQTAFRVASWGARLRDLRNPEFGRFNIICKSSKDLGLGGRFRFFYRLPNKTITINKLSKVFKGVI